MCLASFRELRRGNAHQPGMPLLYHAAADLTVFLHMGYALFIVLGQLAIAAGVVMRWRWIRNMTFRWLHLVAILIVVIESLLGIVCPLTTLEKWLRTQAGQASYQGDFIANCVHETLFVSFPAWGLTIAYVGFGAIVAVTFWLAPPQRRRTEAVL